MRRWIFGAWMIGISTLFPSRNIYLDLNFIKDTIKSRKLQEAGERPVHFTSLHKLNVSVQPNLFRFMDWLWLTMIDLILQVEHKKPSMNTHPVPEIFVNTFLLQQCNKCGALLLLPSLISRRTTNCRTSSWQNFRSAMISLSLTPQAQSCESHVVQWHPWCSCLCGLSALCCNSSGRAPSSPSQRACGSWMPSREVWHIYGGGHLDSVNTMHQEHWGFLLEVYSYLGQSIQVSCANPRI